MPALEQQSGQLPARNLVLTAATAQLKPQAFGCHKLRSLRAEGLSPEGERLQEWLGRGLGGEMSWLSGDPDQRADPRRLFPEARSVVVVALNY